MLIKIGIIISLLSMFILIIYKFGKEAKETEIIKNNNILRKKYDKKKINNSNDLSNVLQNGKY